jgi:hypothetical protein
MRLIARSAPRSLEGEVEAGLRAFRCIALVAEFRTQHPADFEVGPAFRIHQADAADELATVLQFHCPHAVTAQGPMTDQHGHRAPCVHAVQRLAVADEARTGGIGKHGRILLEMTLRERGEAQSFGFDHGNVKHGGIQARSSSNACEDILRLSFQLYPTMRLPLCASWKSSSCPGASRWR